jgi:hypothetical protein
MHLKAAAHPAGGSPEYRAGNSNSVGCATVIFGKDWATATLGTTATLGNRFSEKIMIHQNARATTDSI